MGQFSKVLLAIDNAHTVPQRVMDCGPGLGGLNQVYEHNLLEYINPCSWYCLRDLGQYESQCVTV